MAPAAFSPVNVLQNLVSATAEDAAAETLPELDRIGAAANLAQHLAAVGTGADRRQLDFTVGNHGIGADGNLASAAKLVEQSTLADGGQARRLIS